MTVLRNDGRWDRSNVVYRDGRVLAYDKAAPSSDMHWIDYGLGGLAVSALRLVDAEEPDLSVLHGRLAEAGELCGYEVTERFYEIGTVAGLEDTERFLRGLTLRPR
jgi:hypothetical protein